MLSGTELPNLHCSINQYCANYLKFLHIYKSKEILNIFCRKAKFDPLFKSFCPLTILGRNASEL